MQKNSDSLASFNALYLHISGKVLTHTHTHTHTHTGATGVLSYFFLPSYAREKRAVTLVNKGLLRVPFVLLFMPFCQVARGK